MFCRLGSVEDEPPGLRADQRVAGVDAARLRVDRRLQRLGIGRAQLGELAPFEHRCGLRCCSGRSSLAARSSSRPASVDHCPLLPLLAALAGPACRTGIRRAAWACRWLKLLAGEIVDFRPPAAPTALRELGGERAPAFSRSTLMPWRSISRHHRDQRPVDASRRRVVDALVRQARLQQHPMQPPGHVGILGGIVGRLVERHLAEGDCPTSWRRRVPQTSLKGMQVCCKCRSASCVHAVLRCGRRRARRTSAWCRRSARRRCRAAPAPCSRT